MRSRALFAFSIFLLLTLLACSKKPADTTSDAASQNSGQSAASPANSADQNAAAPSNAASGNAAAPSKAARGNAMRSPAASAAPAQAPEPQPVVVPAGTTLTVRLGNSVGSRISSPGDSFSATLASAVTVDGNTVIPAGASVRGTVVDAKALGKFKGGASLELRLNSITVNETEQTIETSAISRTEKGKGKRTAVIAGGGTALGALIGGLAGGGKGAAIGAAAGGGAGVGGAALTGNKEIVLPAESALSFTLKSPLEVNPAK
jgi:hypothetical protein